MSVYLFCARRSCARMPPLQPNAAEIASARSVVAFLAHRRLTDERVAATISLRVRTSRGGGGRPQHHEGSPWRPMGPTSEQTALPPKPPKNLHVAQTPRRPPPSLARNSHKPKARRQLGSALSLASKNLISSQSCAGCTVDKPCSPRPFPRPPCPFPMVPLPQPQRRKKNPLCLSPLPPRSARCTASFR